MRVQTLVLLLCAFGLGIGAGLLFATVGQTGVVTVRFNDAPADGVIRVYVSGAVRTPGVYSVRAGDRVVDAVGAAGGPAADADTEAINFAQRVQDEGQVYVPRVGEVAAPPTASATATIATAARVDINRADVALLRGLPGVGATRAANIIASRQKDGPFKTTDDLLARKLVTPNIYTQLKDLIEVVP